MDITAPEGLIEHFSKLEDPRVDRNKKHELIDVVVLCVCAVLSGSEGWSDIEEFGRTKLDLRDPLIFCFRIDAQLIEYMYCSQFLTMLASVDVGV